MPSIRISKALNNRIHFLTFTVMRWYYLFDRHQRWNILANSLKYCQKEKELRIYSYVLMLNHMHLLVSAPDIAGFARDFKKHTSKELRRNISETEPNILELFMEEPGRYQFWKPTNMPKIVETADFFQQKLRYIENNPVKKQYVKRPEYWYWSSANPDSEIPVERIITS